MRADARQRVGSSRFWNSRSSGVGTALDTRNFQQHWLKVAAVRRVARALLLERSLGGADVQRLRDERTERIVQSGLQRDCGRVYVPKGIRDMVNTRFSGTAA